MKYLILATGHIEKSELTELTRQPCAVHTINADEGCPLNLFSLLLSEVKLFDEASGDELAALTAVVRPEESHTLLVFDDEQAMIQAKLLVQGLADTQWCTSTNFSHGVRFSSHFTEKQMNEVALLGAQLHRLMAVESSQRMAIEALMDPDHCDEITRRHIITDSQIGLEAVVASRIRATKQLIEIQKQFGICPCQG